MVNYGHANDAIGLGLSYREAEGSLLVSPEIPHSFTMTSSPFCASPPK